MGLGRLLHAHPSAETPGITLRHGHGYDLFGSVFFGGRRNAVFTGLAARSGIQDGDRVLDIGCGTGYLTHRLAKVAPGSTVLGMDPSDSMLTRARHLAPPNCTFTSGIAEHLPTPDESFDVVTSSLMIHHLPDNLRPTAIGEMFRVLRPGGSVLVADFRPPSSRIGRHLVGALTGPAMEHNPVGLLDSLVTGAGFEQVTTGNLRPWIHYVRATKPVTAA
jgi:ubiquinone/menaquinone biosynthesis C-methylase UbiE